MFNNEFEDNNIGNEFSELIERYEAMVGSEALSFFEEEEFEWIIDYYETRNELDKALEAAQYGEKQYPFSALFIHKQAELFFEQRDIDRALALLDKAAVYDGTDIEIYLLRAEILTYQGFFVEAIQTLRHVEDTAEGEDKEELYLSIAEVYESWEKFDLVFDALKNVLSLNPANEEALNRIWFCVDMMENYDESVVLHRQLIDNDPYAFLAWYNLGQAYMGLGDYEAAAEAFEYVILINEDFDVAYRDWGEVLIRLDKPTEALEVFESALRLAEPYEEIYFGMGVCYERLAKPGKARYYYRKALQLDPYYDEALYRIAESLKGEGKINDALQAYKKALKIDEQNIGYLKGFAEMHYLAGQVDEAIVNYRKITVLQPEVEEHWLTLARFAYEIGDWPLAATTCEDALYHLPDSPNMQMHYAAYALACGQYNDGLIALGQALILRPDWFNKVFEIHPGLLDDDIVIDAVDRFSQEL